MISKIFITTLPSSKKSYTKVLLSGQYGALKKCIVCTAFLLFVLSCDESLNENNGNAVYSVEINEPVRVLEGTNLVFTITRHTDTSNEAVVSYRFSGEAAYGEDYIDPNARSISFASGQTTAEIILETLQDDETEEEETVILTLTSATDGSIDPDLLEATGYIRDGIPTCVGPDGTELLVHFDDIEGPGVSRLQDGYHGFIWGDWWVKDDILRSQDEGKEPAYGWFDGIVSAPHAIYPSFGAQPGSVSVITRDEPFVLKSFYMSALAMDELPVTLRYRARDGSIMGEETFVVSRGEKALIEPDVDIMYVNCLRTISFNQPQLGASFIIDDMTFIY